LEGAWEVSRVRKEIQKKKSWRIVSVWAFRINFGRKKKKGKVVELMSLFYTFDCIYPLKWNLAIYTPMYKKISWAPYRAGP